MTPFVSELAKKLAEKWLTLLVLPGALLVGVAAMGAALGQRHATDVGLLLGQADRFTAALATRPASSTVLLLLGLLALAAGAGLCATALGALVGRFWSGRWPRWASPVTARMVRRRSERHQALDIAHAEAVERRYRASDGPDPDVLGRRRNAIALHTPARPTWIGDRMASVQQRVREHHGGVDLVVAWPRLWLVVPESDRTELRAAAAAYDGAAVLAGWGILYMALGAAWWPAGLAGLVTVVTAWSRARRDVDAYADLVESTVDLRLHTLAEHLGLTTDDVHVLGEELNERFGKGALGGRGR